MRYLRLVGLLLLLALAGTVSAAVWQTQVVDSAGDVGDDSSLAFRAGGGSAYWMSYFDATNSDLKLARGVPPSASFAAVPGTGAAPLAVTFSDASTGTVESWAWEFGDGATSADRNPVHTYTKAGTFTANLTVANGAGPARTARTVTVTAPPQANFTWTPAAPVAGGPVAFMDTSTGGPVGWEWSFGDGNTSIAQNPVHAYGSPGNYTVRLTAYYPGSEIGRDCARAITVTPAISVVSGGTDLPTDTNSDGLYDDVNGNGRKDFADVVLYFNQLSWIAANEPLEAFDYNGNGRIDFADVAWLFNHL